VIFFLHFTLRNNENEILLILCGCQEYLGQVPQFIFELSETKTPVETSDNLLETSIKLYSSIFAKGVSEVLCVILEYHNYLDLSQTYWLLLTMKVRFFKLAFYKL
jgi:hypothetical protein